MDQTSDVRIADAPGVRDALIKLDIWLEGQCLKHDVPGLSVGLVHDQELIWSKGYGFADVARNIPATDQVLFRVGSITKTFTATAVMQLVEQGKLSLEDPVSRHLPWFTPMQADPTQPVRVWHLLTHTAGLQHNPPGTDWDNLEGPDIATIRSAARATPLSLPTQTRPKYSNYGFIIVGELVAQVSGMPYTRYVQEKVLQPLGMTNSFFLDGTETRPGLAVPYGRRLSGQARDIEQQFKQGDLTAAGGLVTNVRDLARWASLQFNEADEYKGPVLTGRSLREMHRPRFLVADWSQGFGLAWWLIRGEQRAAIYHAGSVPGYRCGLLINPASKVAVIALKNSDDSLALTRPMMKIVSGPIAAAAISRETKAAVTADLTRFEGLYRSRWGGYARVVALSGRLRIIGLDADDIEAAIITLKQIGPARFLTQAGDSAFSDIESVVEFTMDPSGRATSFTEENGSYRLHRVEEGTRPGRA